MKRITVQNFKSIIIILCCCLCVTITNCDKKLPGKRSILGTNTEPLKKLKRSQSDQILATPPPENSDLNHENSLNNKADKIIPGPIIPKSEKKSKTKKLTSNSSNDKTNLTEVITPGKDITTTATAVIPTIISSDLVPTNAGALLRGASVFLGLSIIVIAYIIFRCARLNKNRPQMVRKYGVLTHRQDVEMRPLPLDEEDEDDTTVFDASEIAAIHDKQRRWT